MTTLFTYVRNVETDEPYYAIVADDSGAEYVWPKGDEPWFDLDQRLDFIMAEDEDDPTDAAGWLALASRHLGPEFTTDPPFDDASNAAQAKRLASSYLDQTRESRVEDTNPTLSGVPAAFDQVTEDYPAFADSDEGLAGDETGATDNMVLMALGPIDPAGPNGWILRAMDGEPADGDENEYVHFPSTMTPGSNENEEAPE